MKKMHLLVFGLVLSLMSNIVFADSVQGKIVSLQPCAHDSEAYTLVTFENGDVYRLISTSPSSAYLAALRKNIYSMLLLAYERDYMLSIKTGRGAMTKCGVASLGHIEAITLDKNL